jgi:hypothetical protein
MKVQTAWGHNIPPYLDPHYACTCSTLVPLNSWLNIPHHILVLLMPSVHFSSILVNQFKPCKEMVKNLVFWPLLSVNWENIQRLVPENLAKKSKEKSRLLPAIFMSLISCASIAIANSHFEYSSFYFIYLCTLAAAKYYISHFHVHCMC